MDDTELYDDKFVLARREESKLHNELDYFERVAKGQKEQLDALLQHKDECVKGIAKAKQTGLAPMHVREFKILLTHINSTVDTISHKVVESQANYEEAKELWSEKNVIYQTLKEEVRQILLDRELSLEKEILLGGEQGVIGDEDAETEDEDEDEDEDGIIKYAYKL